MLSAQTVLIVTGGFTIENGMVVPITDYTADAELLGTGYTWGADGPRIPIDLEFDIGGQSHDPWPGVINDDENPREHTFTEQSAGSPISVAATPLGGPSDGVTRWSSDDGWIQVLRDGDAVPSTEGFGDQDSIAGYVAPYVSEDAETVELAENQAIYLFELSNSQTGDAADYQDVVVLVSLHTSQEVVGTHQSSHEQLVLVCPSES